MTQLKDLRINSSADLLRQIKDDSIPLETLESIREALLKHLQTPGASVDNFCGSFGKSVAKAAIDKYPDILNQDDLDRETDRNTLRLVSSIYSTAIANRKINVSAEMLKLLISLTNKQNQDATPGTLEVNLVCEGIDDVTA